MRKINICFLPMKHNINNIKGRMTMYAIVCISNRNEFQAIINHDEL